MKYMIERTLTGAFRARRAGCGQLAIVDGRSGRARDLLAGVERDAAAALDGCDARAPSSVAWSGAGAAVTLTSAGASTAIQIARRCVIHEPRPQLYDALPLVELGRCSAAFLAARVLIARIPGGRRLLRWIAQRTRRRLARRNCITGAGGYCQCRPALPEICIK